MFARTRALVRLRSRPSVLLLFGLTILLPGVLLTVFAVRALVQERRFAQQQVRERLDRAAQIAAQDLERDLHAWQAALARIGEPRVGDVAAALPDRLRASIEEPGAAAVTFLGAHDRQVWPERQVLYQVAPSSAVAAPAPLDQSVSEAEEVELREKNYPRAIALYERALAAAPRDRRAPILHRLARTLRKAGREKEALALYRTLAASSDRIGALPADLIAQYEICSVLASQDARAELASAALDLYRGLVEGRWALEKARYLFYAATAREWLTSDGTPTAEVARWVSVEDQKQSLTDAIAALFDAPGLSSQSVDDRFSVVQSTGSREVALVVANAWLAAHVWPDTFKTMAAEGVDVALVGPAGDVLFGPPQDSRALDAGFPTVTRAADDPAVPWRVRVSARDPAALSADLARRQTLSLVMLLLVVALLTFGTYFTLRVVRKEIEVARLKSDFVSTVSHEFRSPLTGIRQLGELLMRGRVPSEERRQEYYERITRESDRLSRLVENLLDFSRMEDGRKEYRFEQLDPAPWLHQLVEDSRSQHADAHLAIVATIPDTLPPLIADRDALSCAVQNLIDNAVKYSPGRDTVWLDAEACNSHLTIRVRDQGVGINEDDRRHIFEKFYRGHADITRQVQGAGLGLSLVSHIVSAHGGQVECESHAGEGTTFAIVLPVQTA